MDTQYKIPVETLPSTVLTTSTGLSLSGGTMTGAIIIDGRSITFIKQTDNAHNVIISSGTTYADSSNLKLFGATSDNNGAAQLTACDGTNTVNLSCYANGTLQWGGKNIERVSAIGTGYVRYESGLQICWGSFTGGTGTTITFPMAFVSNAATKIMFQPYLGSPSGSIYFATVAGQDTSQFAVNINVLSTSGYTPWVTDTPNINWIAIGLWK